MARVRTPTPVKTANHVVEHKSASSPKQRYTVLPAWLIDSGCSAHMTPNLEDLIQDREKTKTVVEVATGVFVKASVQGTVKILITDIYSGKECFVYLNNVLHVPGLTKRLLSVRQWNVSGGDIFFKTDHYVFTVYDSITGKSDKVLHQSAVCRHLKRTAFAINTTSCTVQNA